ncbi:MAG: DUF4160 domain-containing protein [Chitinophagales bacterium]|nr:DUF4160 domain-containing protein [Chitinophagales bacterium]
MERGYKFKFYSNENEEPAHVHVTKGAGNAKYWLEPSIEEVYSYGFTVRERREIKKSIRSNSDLLKKKWHEYFKKNSE